MRHLKEQPASAVIRHTRPVNRPAGLNDVVKDEVVDERRKLI
jgi:hypothetical protein